MSGEEGWFGRLKRRYREMSMSSRWYAASVLLLIIPAILVFAFQVQAPTSSDVTFSEFMSFHVMATLLWISAMFLIRGHTDSLEEASREMSKIPQTSPATTSTRYKLQVEWLHARSDNLDSVRSNLWNGTYLFFAVGSAFVVALFSIDIQPPITKLMLLIASSVLALGALVSVIFSFTDISGRYPGIVLSDGLLPTESTEQEYQTQLESTIGAKEETLSKMRQTLGLGFLDLALHHCLQ
ncbi:MAG: hypothetical protein ACE5H4_11400, partial [Candidatus Thorarchaeota archaeon]